MNAEEIAHATAERKLIIENLINGVEPDDIARTFRRSKDDVLRDFAFAVKKIKSYVFERRAPMFSCETVGEARGNKALFLFFLDRVNLAIGPKYPRISTEQLDDQTMRRMGLYR